MFNVNNKVRVNNELCPENKLTEPNFQFGQLNYPVFLLDWQFEVKRTFTDDYHGEMVECEVLGVDDIEPDALVVLRCADILMSGASKVKINFEILGQVNQNSELMKSLTAQLKKLESQRNKQKLAGDKISSPVLKENWAKIKDLNAQLKTLLADTKTVYKVKTASGIYELDCKEDQIENRIRSKIRASRAERKKVSPIVKTISGNIQYEKVGGVLAKKGEFARINKNYALNVIGEHKKPTTATDNYVGIEVEMLGTKDIESMKKEFIKAKLHKHVNIGTDGSVRTDKSGQYAMELRIIVKESERVDVLTRIFQVLKDTKATVNDSCGTHVHIDMRNRDVEKCYYNLFKVQSLMLATQPEKRRKNSYCKPNERATLKVEEFEQQDRYRLINVQAYRKLKTIEIRLHQGTVDLKDITAWINFLVAVASKTDKIKSAVETVKELQEQVTLDEDSLKHLQKRITKNA